MRLQTTISIFTMTMVGALMAACGDDEDGGQDPSGASEDASTAASDPTTTATGAESDTVDDAETTAVDPTDAETTGDAETTDPDSSGTDTTVGTTGEEAGEYAALVRGALFTADLEEAQGVHDPLASAGRAGAMALGDFGHDVVLGTTLLGTTQDEFVAVDRWTSLEGAVTLYSDPDFAEAFAMLFAEPVMPALFERRADWHGWGDLDAADDAESRFVVVVRGHLAEKDPDDAQPLHDQLASGGEETATMLGDVAHVVWLGVDDPREFFAIDVWTSDESIETFYSNPEFQAGFAMLFDAPPSVGVYRSTDWHQW